MHTNCCKRGSDYKISLSIERTGRAIQWYSRFKVAPLRGRFPKRLGRIYHPSNIRVQHTSVHVNPTPTIQSRSHPKTAGTRHNMAANNFGHCNCRLSAIPTPTNLTPGHAAEKNGKCESAANASDLEADYVRRVRIEPNFVPGDYLFLERPALTTSPARRTIAEECTMLLPRCLGRYCIISGGPEFVKIWLDRIENMLLITL